LFRNYLAKTKTIKKRKIFLSCDYRKIFYVCSMDLKIAVIIPDRNDRPNFLANCLRMIKSQTVQPLIVELVNQKSPAADNEKDITWLYRTGYDKLRNKGLDCILFMENDDFYATDYIETITKEWIKHERPKIFGTNYTIYYHIALKSYVKLEHYSRSSAMSTLIQPDLQIDWGRDDYPYTDSWLWLKNGLNGITFKPSKHICIGMKHGVGLCGGRYHTDDWMSNLKTMTGDFKKYRNADSESNFLREVMDAESFNFFTNIKL
jgi:hypothetical protein